MSSALSINSDKRQPLGTYYWSQIQKRFGDPYIEIDIIDPFEEVLSYYDKSYTTLESAEIF